MRFLAWLICWLDGPHTLLAYGFDEKRGRYGKCYCQMYREREVVTREAA